MTKDSDRKKLVRDIAQNNGISYTKALRIYQNNDLGKQRALPNITLDLSVMWDRDFPATSWIVGNNDAQLSNIALAATAKASEVSAIVARVASESRPYELPGQSLISIDQGWVESHSGILDAVQVERHRENSTWRLSSLLVLLDRGTKEVDLVEVRRCVSERVLNPLYGCSYDVIFGIEGESGSLPLESLVESARDAIDASPLVRLMIGQPVLSQSIADLMPSDNVLINFHPSLALGDDREYADIATWTLVRYLNYVLGSATATSGRVDRRQSLLVLNGLPLDRGGAGAVKDMFDMGSREFGRKHNVLSTLSGSISELSAVVDELSLMVSVLQNDGTLVNVNPRHPSMVTLAQ